MHKLKKAFVQVIIVFCIILFSAFYYYSYVSENQIASAFIMPGGVGSNAVVTRVDTGGEKLVALTFDDGPDPRFTPQVLDILKIYKIHATFFVLGESVEAHPEIVVRQMLEGHEIENHTYTHADLRLLNNYSTEEEIKKTGEVIRRLTHRQPVYFRPPRKMFRKETVEITGKNGYEMVLWTVCVENHATPTPEEMAQRVIKGAKPGMIILTHDGVLDRSKSVKALPILIEGLQKKGYRFVTLDELIQTGAEKTQALESVEGEYWY